jgi:DNA-binding CsgD family transcriptional regulator
MDLHAQGHTGEDHDDKHELSTETVKTHNPNAMAKHESHTRDHADANALREG